MAFSNQRSGSARDDRLRRPSPRESGGKAAIENLRSRLASISRRRVVACVVAGSVAIVTANAVQSAQQQAASWGVVTPVLVATEEIGSGDAIGPQNTSLRSLPLAVLPNEPLSVLDGSSFAAAAIGEGQILNRLDIFEDRDGLKQHLRAITLPSPLAPPPVENGDLVEIFGVHPAQAGIQAVTLVKRARVVDLTPDGITVVVLHQEVEPLLLALASGSVELVRRPP